MVTKNSNSNKKGLPQGGFEPPDPRTEGRTAIKRIYPRVDLNLRTFELKMNVLTTTPRQLHYITDKIFLTDQFDKPHEVPVLHQKFQISNFQI